MPKLSVAIASLVAVPLSLSAGAASAAGCAQRDPVGVAVVYGADRAYFHGDAGFCPNGKAYCLKRAYVVAGDHVLIAGSQDGFTCVQMPGKDTTTFGWIEAKRLRSERTNPSPPSSAWEGVWKNERVMQIEIARDQNGLHASGLDDWRDGDGRVHHAEFSGRLRVTDTHAHVAGRECAVDLTLLNTFLVVEDDNSCDPNTSFRGIYNRRP